MIDPLLLQLLACPACEDRPPLRLEGEGLVCDQCQRIYPIRDGIPHVVISEAILPGSPAPTEET
jgi:uncharacterized protein YbaR (Trm112 family)